MVSHMRTLDKNNKDLRDKVVKMEKDNEEKDPHVSVTGTQGS